MFRIKSVFMILLFCIFSTLFSKQVILQMKDETSLKCELLYCSDSLLYVWTGFEKFDKEFMEIDTLTNIHAFQISQFRKVKLRIVKSFYEYAVSAYKVSLLTGGFITYLNFHEQNFKSTLILNGVFNIIYGTGLAAILQTIWSIPNNLDFTNPNKYDASLQRLRCECIFNKNPDEQAINSIIQNIKPL